MWDAIYKYSVLLLVYFRICVGKLTNKGKGDEGDTSMA